MKESSRNRPRTTHPLSALSSTAVSLPATTTDDRFHVPSSISRAMATLRQLPKTPSTSCVLAVLVDNKRLPGIIPFHRLTPISSAIVAAIIGVPQQRFLRRPMRVTSHRSDPALPSPILFYFAHARRPSKF
jgi:hypothetical protein